MVPSPSEISRKVAFPIPRLAIPRPANETLLSSGASAEFSNSDIASALVWVLWNLAGYGSIPISRSFFTFTRRTLKNSLSDWLNLSPVSVQAYWYKNLILRMETLGRVGI